MTESEVVQLLTAYFATLFPRTCSTCGRRFASLHDWIRETTPLPRVMSYDAELGDWRPAALVGTLALANCPCGSTLALTTDGLSTPVRRDLLEWLRQESARDGLAPSEVLDRVRRKVRGAVSGDGAL